MNDINERKKLAGNGCKYAPDRIKVLLDSPLKGMTVCFLGSSVTYGAASSGISFAEYLAKRNRMHFVKEAVSGTTLTDDGADSYISRMKGLDRSARFDLFVCQLSTNDATKKRPLGEISSPIPFRKNEIPGTGSASACHASLVPAVPVAPDTSTVCGAVEYIIGYVRAVWGCPIVFYTNPYYDSAAYAAMVRALLDIGKLYGVGVIDLYSDPSFNDISKDRRALYMADDIHPTRAGYLEWWTPKMEEYLYSFFGTGGIRDRSEKHGKA